MHSAQSPAHDTHLQILALKVISNHSRGSQRGSALSLDGGELAGSSMLLLLFLKSSPVTGFHPHQGLGVAGQGGRGHQGGTILVQCGVVEAGAAIRGSLCHRPPGSQSPWGSWHGRVVPRQAEGAPVDSRGVREVSKTGLGLSEPIKGCLLE